MTYYPQTGTKLRQSPPKTRRKLGDPSHHKLNNYEERSRRMGMHDDTETTREKLIEAEVYKENYQKLKEKYRK